MNHNNNRSYKQEMQLENWKRVWQCRDFELSHLWQRSIFLTAFLILIYSGYGIYIQQLLKPIITSSGDIKWITSKPIHHIIALGMCTMGATLSALWIMMAKGSKFWYECYENKICEIEKKFNILMQMM